MPKILEKPKILMAKAAEGVQEAAGNTKEKAEEAAGILIDKAEDTRDRIDIAWFGPIFDFEEVHDNMPRVIHIADKPRMRNRKACEGAIGYRERIKGMKMMGLLPENVSLPDINFWPNNDGVLYYRDPYDDHLYIDLDDYFDYLNEVRVNEIKDVAHALGAKHVRVVYKEEKKSLISVAAKARAKGKEKGKIKAGAAVEAKAEHSKRTNEYSNIEVKAEVDYKGSSEPVLPELKYLKNDTSIQSLIRARMDGDKSMKKYTYSIRCKTLNGFHQEDVAKIDGVLKQLKLGGNTSVASEAETEGRAILEYTIEF